MIELDFSGMTCPGPVIETKKYLEKHPKTLKLQIVVDNTAASENVSRFLSNSGYESSIEKDAENFNIVAKKDESLKVKNDDKKTSSGSTLIMFTHNTLGTGSKELGEKLMFNFLKTLPEMNNLWRLVFVNEAVMLTVGNSDTIEPLKQLEEAGVSILVCGTCLEYYKVLEDKKVGETTNMLDIVTSLDVADKVINY
ncbi:MAG: sulfurtransferase-like selenium metabolism protein YedF [Desulfobacterales bacterium]|nr:sulfurtransferase-like selenium metabolism protein YedF [Desulfobacterales bacterium]MCP4158812.1 sulfurtransferase-like selenium metabolism protein YedF [Deltaproteobacteria bacterium]